MRLHFITPGRPVENAYIESFDGRVRDECLNENWFLGLRDARAIIETGRRDDNAVRPHTSLAGRSPDESPQHWIDAHLRENTSTCRQRLTL